MGLASAPVRLRTRDLAAGLAAGAASVAAVTALIAGLDQWFPPLSLGTLYVLAVVGVALGWGALLAVPVGIASMLAYNYFLLPPRGTLHLRDPEHWLALAVYLAVGLVVSGLAARSRQREQEAVRRERETAVLAAAAAALLGSSGAGTRQDDLHRISEGVAAALGVPGARLSEAGGQGGVPLRVGGETVATLQLPHGARPDPVALATLLPALASLLALARERERLEREAREAETLRTSDALKTAVLRSVSHDLRSPLTAIAASAEALANPALDLAPDDRDELLATVLDETRRLTRMVSDLLDLSRLEAGAARPRLEAVDVESLVALALDATPGEERVQVALQPGCEAVRVDVAQLRQVLVNLLENALRHGGPAGTVRIEAAAQPGRVAIRVADDGPGIPAEEADAVFEPFRQGRAGPDARGSGLGLAIARGLAEANGCSLRLLPAERGAVFELALPAVPVSVPEPAA